MATRVNETPANSRKKENKLTNVAVGAVTHFKKSVVVKADRSASGRKTVDDPCKQKFNIYMRMRPLLSCEKAFDFEIEDSAVTIRTLPSMSCPTTEKCFEFRDIIGPESDQEHVFNTVVAPMLTRFTSGEDVLVFCYGSANAGKTYTVSGTDDEPGILRRTLDVLLKYTRSGGRKTIHASVIEIYNEKTFDLLNAQSGELRLIVEKSGYTVVKGVSEMLVSSPKNIDELIAQSGEGRHRSITEAHRIGSRSHVIFRLRLTEHNKSSWLSIVDLAGCERASVATSSPESSNVNRSMLALGKCLRTLRRQGSAQRAVASPPYRESKITQLFKNFFEPHSRTAHVAMIVNASPSLVHIDNTLFALQFATDAKHCSVRQTHAETEVRTSGKDGSKSGRARQTPKTETEVRAGTKADIKPSTMRGTPKAETEVHKNDKTCVKPSTTRSTPKAENEVHGNDKACVKSSTASQTPKTETEALVIVTGFDETTSRSAVIVAMDDVIARREAQRKREIDIFERAKQSTFLRVFALWQTSVNSDHEEVDLLEQELHAVTCHNADIHQMRDRSSASLASLSSSLTQTSEHASALSLQNAILDASIVELHSDNSSLTDLIASEKVEFSQRTQTVSALPSMPDVDTEMIYPAAAAKSVAAPTVYRPQGRIIVPACP